MLADRCAFAISICVLVFIVFVSRYNTFQDGNNGWGGSASAVAMQTTSGIMGQTDKPYLSLAQIMAGEDMENSPVDEVDSQKAPVIYNRPFDDTKIKFPKVNLNRKGKMTNYSWNDQNLGSYEYPYINQRFPCDDYGNCRSIPT
jgi:hypothetical protein